MRNKFLTIILGSIVALAGCKTAGKRTAVGAGTGAAIGAVGGAIIGHQSGNRDKGAAIGAGIGGAIGAGIGYKLDKQAKELEEIAETRRTEDGLITTLKENLLFDTDSFALKSSAKDSVSQISDIIKKYPEDRVLIIGHTDDVGSQSHNQTLSEHRANSVRTYMITKGIPAGSLEAVGMGETEPVVPNSSAANRSKNRRVELRITMVENSKS